MRLALIAPFPPNRDGVGDYTEKFVLALARFAPGMEICVFSHQESGAPEDTYVASNIRVRRVLCARNLWRKHMGWARLVPEIIRFKPDVIHFEGGLLPNYGGKFGEPLIPLMATFRSLGICLVATFHSTWLPEDVCALAREKGFSVEMARAIQRYYRFLVHVFCRTLHCVSICTAGEISASAEEFRKAYAVPNRKLVLEPHPCDYCLASREAQEAAKRELGIGERRMLLALGFVRPDKGFHVLLESAPVLLKQFPDLVVCVAGNPGRSQDKEYAQRLTDLRNRTGAPDRVLLDMRYLSAEQFSRYLDAAEIVVVPYLRSVGPSGPTHIALGRGTPVVATDIGHNRALMRGCLLVPPGDPAALADTLFHLLSNPAKATELRAQATSYAAKHTWDQLAASYVRHYERLLTPRWDVEQAELRVLGPELNMKSSKQESVATQS